MHSKRLSPGQKALFFIWYLDAEVTNGGFIQFYWNGKGYDLVTSSSATWQQLFGLLLLQIDTDNEIMFGDSGVANVFINEDDLKKKKFDKAYFNWDCC
jgi:uncharacterized protein YwqG